MVYRGLPSKACHMCRKRHLRCDQKEKGCGNCRRANIECPGYRSQLDALFVDETDVTLQKQQRRKHDGLTRPREALSPAVADLALGYFYKHHMIHGDANSNAACSSVSDPWLSLSMQALGLAAHASITQQPWEMTKAQEYYGSAIANLNNALRSEVRAKQDSTLLAVIILSYFETMIGSDREMDAWCRHIHGTAALIQKRGLNQLSTEEGRILFMVATTNMMSDCSRLGIRLPKSIHTIWNNGLKDVVDTKDPVYRSHTAWLKLIDFYSDARNRRKDLATAILEGLEIDKELMSVFDDASVLWAYDVKPSPPSSSTSARPGYTHFYKSALCVQIWNAVRSGRLVVHRIISKMLWHINLSGSETSNKVYTDQLRKSMEIIKLMKMDILATVPQFLGFETPDNEARTRPASVDSHESTPSTGVQDLDPRIPPMPDIEISQVVSLRSRQLPGLRTATFNFVWTIALVGRETSKADPLRITICEYLRTAGVRQGIQLAFLFADMLEQGEKFHDQPNHAT